MDPDRRRPTRRALLGGAAAGGAGFAAARATAPRAATRTRVEVAADPMGLYNVRGAPFFAKGDGVADDTRAIQAAIDASLGGSPGNATPVPIRSAAGAVYLPAGNYKVTSSLHVTSAQGFHIYGDGQEQTALVVPAGTRIAGNLLDVNGSSGGMFEAFSLQTTAPRQGSSGSHADTMFALYHDPLTAARSTTNNTIRNVTIGEPGNGSFRAGFGIGTNDNRPQCDSTIFIACIVRGDVVDPLDPRVPVAVGSSPEQTAWWFGHGEFANNLDHWMYGCSWFQVVRGVYADNVSVSVKGAQSSAAVTDLVIGGSQFPVVLESLRSERASKLLLHAAGSADAHVSLRDVLWNGLRIGTTAIDQTTGAVITGAKSQPDPYWIDSRSGGCLMLDNVTCLNSRGSIEPVVRVGLSTVPAGSLQSCVATGVGSPTPFTGTDGSLRAFSISEGVTLTAQHYHEINADVNTAKVTPLHIQQGRKVLLRA